MRVRFAVSEEAAAFDGGGNFERDHVLPGGIVVPDPLEDIARENM